MTDFPLPTEAVEAAAKAIEPYIALNTVLDLRQRINYREAEAADAAKAALRAAFEAIGMTVEEASFVETMGYGMRRRLVSAWVLVEHRLTARPVSDASN